MSGEALLEGSCALIIGASRGIGAAIGRRLSHAGAQVALVGRAETELRALASQLSEETGRQAHSLCFDIADPEAATAAVVTARERLGSLDVLVNSAGVTARADATELTAEDWDQVMAVNLRATFLTAREAARTMITEQHGSILNIASLSSHFGIRRAAAYGASKGGVAQLTRALALEWGPHGVRVNAIAPGYIETDLTRGLVEDSARYEAVRARIPLGRWGTPDDVAQAAVLLCSPLASYITGQIVFVDGGYTADG
jgi:NAD(P)-dependent dehydrogenase (short-subunit alcohol dehydrogenase family)